MSTLQLQTITPDTLDQVLDIQAVCYPAHYHEPRSVFARKLALSPDSHWLAWRDNEALGYFFTHPWRGLTPPPLATELAGLPPDPDCHFLHDLAIHPRARGSGVAQALIEHALAWGRQQQMTKALLVAVQGAAPFWARHGFRELGAAPGYGDSAILMHRQ
ncbi:GNAT family N-acetyltransferase [Jeongeupia naejangsanensis]|uniref:GNAT family N-acetyltransferase n=1 Tax=Jeongeupia naejangsanensis TaxID=613195 RepID=A0ABS2BJ45_9NEIS|nr:GNAT family N-acetyltransferase [Jeongeupia naejangsanensis]MBM3115619.1 GNAT family N-acetyltransferase [Jeongeupia naejangsanensis]